ncbi:MAG: hypothetical protein IJD40_04925 [Lachnospiraceae bacterium]|nr:hypothetical protein [Lachnospiraceae bacterium]
MYDSLRENLSYFGLYKRMFKVKKIIDSEKISFGSDKEQYFLYYEPLDIVSDKVVIWIHGGGWNAGSPKFLILSDSASHKKDIGLFLLDIDCLLKTNIHVKFRR